MNNKQYMIINGIIGDVYGAPIEMMPLEIIHQRYGEIMKNYIISKKLQDKLYAYTDDSEMTLAVLNFIKDNINNNIDLNNENIMKYYTKFFEPHRGYSMNTYNMFINYITTNNIKVDDRLSNGGLMRVSPLVFLSNKSDDELLEYIKVIHYPTHMNDEAIHTSFIYIKLLYSFYDIRDSNNKKNDIITILNNIIPIAKYNIKDFIQYILNNLDNNEYEIVNNKLIGLDGILCYESLSVALWCVIKNINILKPHEIMAKGICYGGDCDTIGSIIGQMTGILFGSDAINYEWYNNIDFSLFLQYL